MKKSLQQLILERLRQSNEFVNGASIEDWARSWGYKLNYTISYTSSYGAREARRLAESGLIIRDDTRDRKKTVWYMAKPPKDTIVYKVQGIEVARKNVYN